LPGLGARYEGLDLVGFEDEGRACWVGGLAEGDPAVGQLLGFEAFTAVGAALGLAPAVSAQGRSRELHDVVYGENITSASPAKWTCVT
jgi:hypothetical protein